MTWQELAEFILKKMPECNRNEQVTVWDASIKNGHFYYIHGISPYDADEKPNGMNFYSIDFNSDVNKIN